ncbi:MAG: hypothetical protein ACK4FV_00070 [Candidatus Nitrosocaldus sp.]
MEENEVMRIWRRYVIITTIIRVIIGTIGAVSAYKYYYVSEQGSANLAAVIDRELHRGE